MGEITFEERQRQQDEHNAQVHLKNAQLLETQLDVKLARARAWSPEWWRIVEDLDHVRGLLILDGGVR